MQNDIDKKRIKDLETVIVLSFVSLVFYFIFRKNIFIFLSVGLLFISLLSNKITSIISNLWLKFSYLTAKVNNNIFLFLTFYIFVTPIAFVYRLFVKNPLFLRKDKNLETYFHKRNHSFEKKDFEKTW